MLQKAGLYTLYAFINTGLIPFRMFSTFQDTVCINVLVITTLSNSCISLIKYMRKTVGATSYKKLRAVIPETLRNFQKNANFDFI